MKKQIKKMISVLMSVSMLSSIALMTTANAKTRDVFTPVTTEDFNDQAQELSLVAPWLTPTYVEETTGSGNYAWHVGFPYNASGLYAQTGNVISSTADKYYIEFNFKTNPCNNMTFTPANSANGTPGISISTSFQGYIVSTGLTPAAKGLANDASVLNNSAATVEANKNGWMLSSSPIAYKADEWHKAKFVYDKTANTISSYIDDTLCRTKTLASGSVADYTKLLFFSHDTASKKATHFYIDNFVVGTVTEEYVPGEPINVKSSMISNDGKISVSFDNDIDSTTITGQNVKLTSYSGGVVNWEAATYDSTTRIWTAQLNGYKNYVDYTLLISGIAGTDNNYINDYSTVIKGNRNVYNPELIEDFDSQQNNVGLTVPYLTPGYIQKSGDDYYWKVNFPLNNEGLYGTTGAVITSDKDRYYISFDFMTNVCDNFSIAPIDSTNNATYISLSMSRNGYMIGTNLLPYVKALSSNTSLLENSMATVAENANGKMNCSLPIEYKANTWYNAKYVFDKTNNTISLYLNDMLLRSTTVADVTIYKRLIIDAHYSGSNNASKMFALDNVEVGEVTTRVSDESLFLTDADGDYVTAINEGEPIYVNANCLNNSENTKSYAAYIACYDENGACIDIRQKKIKDVKDGETATVSGTELGYASVPTGTKMVKALLWGDEGTLAPITRSVSASVVPTAENQSVYVLACSDFQGVASDDASGQQFASSIVRNIISKIKDDRYKSLSGFICCGDYANPTIGNATYSANGITALDNVIKSEYPISKNIYVQGNHDPLTTVGLSSSGANDTDDYGVYVIHQNDYQWGAGNLDATKSAASNLQKYFDDKISQNYKKPIFVATHVPLHWSSRGEGIYANTLFDVINEAGKKGLNIIVMFGHNHGSNYDDYLGGSGIYLKKGDEMRVAQGSSSDIKTEKLWFTYLNAGYVGYSKGIGNAISMTLFEIKDNNVIIKRYTQNGMFDLKIAGVTHSNSTETFTATSATYSSPQIISTIDN